MLTSHAIRRRDAGGHCDVGSALVMAIVFVTVIGIIAAGALSYAAVSLRVSSSRYRPARDRLYAADAAMKTAVAYIASNPSIAQDTGAATCTPATKTFGTVPVTGQPVTVDICPKAGSNSFTTTGGGSGWGLLTLATGSETGLVVSGSLKVTGNVWSNSKITGGTLTVLGGTVKAVGGCTGTITVDGVAAPSCTVASAPATDPAYDLTGVTEAPAPGTGTCNTATGVLSLQPGTWNSSNTPESLLGSCSIINLLPGVHYFDSLNWSIKKRVIAGKLVPGFTSATAVGGACVRGGAVGAGALLVLGGTTQISMQSSTPSLEVCGLNVNQPSLGRTVKMSLYGPAKNVSTTYTDTLTPGANPTGSGWVNPSYARTVGDAVFATYSLAKKSTTNNLVFGTTTSTFAPPNAIVPLSADVTAWSSTAGDTFKVTVLNSDGTTACTTGTAGSLTAALAKTTVSLTCTKPITSTVTARLAVTAPNSGSTRTITVDGLVLNYSGPGAAIAMQSGCVITANGCSVLSSSGNGNTFWFDGEVYLPKAKIAVQLPNASAGFTTLGVVVRVLSTTTTGSTQNIPIVAVDNGVMNPGSVTVRMRVGADEWMTCYVTYAVAGAVVSAGAVQSCTVPR
jgi:hypothetical protein